MFSTLCTETLLLKAWDSVKSKNAGGGVDGLNVSDFDAGIGKNIRELSEDLKAGQWEPQPYLRIEIPKKENEKRKLGLLTIRDKIVQQGIRLLIEPKCENLFFGNSYGYRPGKGATKAIRRLMNERTRKGFDWALKLDIDDFFDNVDHKILQDRLKAIITDAEIVRLVMLCVKMGVVSKSMKWQDTVKGLPQGAVLSPLLANLYLHSFDQFVTSRTQAYVRYADDFVILARSKEEAEKFNAESTTYITQRLKLPLNTPEIRELQDGIGFLGMHITKYSLGISEEKRQELFARIDSFQLRSGKLDKASTKKWSGIVAYYGVLLPEEELQKIDERFFSFLHDALAKDWKSFSNKNILMTFLDEFRFLSTDFRLKDKELKSQLIQTYLSSKKTSSAKENDIENNKIILKRKQEYIRKESENSELVIAKPGAVIGLSKKGVSIKIQGKVLKTCSISNLKHVTILSSGASMSSNFLYSMLKNKIPVDIFSFEGGHMGSFISAASSQCQLWQSQALASTTTRNTLAAIIIDGKLTNQLNLIKYYHKYHKATLKTLQQLLDALELICTTHREFIRAVSPEVPDYMQHISTHESQGAAKYWQCVACLLSNDEVDFQKREHKGATDLVNSLLNYGYSILYTRCWQALLAAQLNPYDSVIHVRQHGKPTFAFDFIEIFRAQAVDRVVISLIQKNEPLEIKDGHLSEDTRKLLVKNITERLYKRETFRKESMTLDRIIKVQAREIAQYFTGNKKFKPYKAKW